MPACLEIACFSPDALLLAAKAGAHRLEYCASYAEGGVTPISGTLLPLRKHIPCPVRVMIRCRGGGFVYSFGELSEMRQQLRRWADEGIDGWVGGCLTPDKMPDCEAMLSIAQAAPSLPFTFHRAFDQCLDPISALQQLQSLGCSHLLSSGTPTAGAWDGIEKLIIYIGQLKRADLNPKNSLASEHLNTHESNQSIDNRGPRLRLILGGGIRRDNIRALFDQFGDAVHYHSAAVSAGVNRCPSTDPLPDQEEIQYLLRSLK
jgi:copper homeostasis protein